LQSRPLPINSGFGSVLTNIGSLSNKGIEFEVRGIVVNSPKFKWDINANIARKRPETNRPGLPGVDTLLNTFFLSPPPINW
jgi:outer membrane receptor protein involved in Fe transport